MFAQADVETDEVYAQMTLQPVSKVGQLFNFNIIIKRFSLILCKAKWVSLWGWLIKISDLQYEKEALLASDMGLKQNRQPTEFFCKTLTASDTSTHGGFSVPRRAAEKIFPPLVRTIFSNMTKILYLWIMCLHLPHKCSPLIILNRTFQCNHLLRSWWPEIYTTIHGRLGIFIEVQPPFDT